MTQTNPSTEKQMSAIDRQLAAIMARKAAKAAAAGETPVEEKAKRAEKPAPADREAKAAAIKADRERRAQERAAKGGDKAEKQAAAEREKEVRRALKEAERQKKREAAAAAKSNKGPSHMKKVEKARAKLPAMSTEAQAQFDAAVVGLSVLQLEVLAQHLLVQARSMRTVAATAASAPKLGAIVRITGGDPKFIGATGEVVHSHKLRILVKVEGVRKPVYLYTGEAEVVEAQAAAAE